MSNFTLDDLRAIMQQIDPQPRAPALGVILVVENWPGDPILQVGPPVDLRFLEQMAGPQAVLECTRLRSHEYVLLMGRQAWAALEGQAQQPLSSRQFGKGFAGVPVKRIRAEPLLPPLIKDGSPNRRREDGQDRSAARAVRHPGRDSSERRGLGRVQCGWYR